MKPPLIFHSLALQQSLIQQGTREQIIEWLAWNDPSGTYKDRDSVAEEMDPLSLERAKEIMRGQSDGLSR